jgi:hypothetical protein
MVVILNSSRFMNRRTKSTFGRRHPKYRRALGYLLLVLITYGVTVEAAQSHGLVRTNRANAADSGDAGGPQSSNKGRSHNRECSMCQFQQQLSSGLVHTPLMVLTPSIQIAFLSTQTVIHLSTATIATSDRAPPRG